MVYRDVCVFNLNFISSHRDNCHSPSPGQLTRSRVGGMDGGEGKNGNDGDGQINKILSHIVINLMMFMCPVYPGDIRQQQKRHSFIEGGWMWTRKKLN